VHVWGWNSRSSVIKNRKSFHLVRVFSRQWWLINFRMHRSDDCRSWIVYCCKFLIAIVNFNVLSLHVFML
jgi:hypothetical protein